MALALLVAAARGQADKEKRIQLESGLKLTGQTKAGKGQTRLSQAGVMYGLAWLARHQAENGSWNASNYLDLCRDASCTGAGHVRFTDGLTGLALLAFLGAGYTPEHRTYLDDPKVDRRLFFGEVVRKGLAYLAARQQKDGSIGSDHYMYNQALAAAALAEACALTPDQKWKDAAQKAINFLHIAQREKRGWRYLPREEVSDTSVTGWCTMALMAGELAGLRVHEENKQWALEFIKGATSKVGKTGYFSAEDAGEKIENAEELAEFKHHESMTAAGMMVRAYVTREWKDAGLERGAAHLAADLPVWNPREKRDFYYWYYGSLALNQYAGPESPNPDKHTWEQWNKALLTALLEHQENVPSEQIAVAEYGDLYRKAKDEACKTGSWEPSDRYGYAGRIYATAINVLTLEVYYRHGNLFKTKPKSATGK